MTIFNKIFALLNISACRSSRLISCLFLPASLLQLPSFRVLSHSPSSHPSSFPTTISISLSVAFLAIARRCDCRVCFPTVSSRRRCLCVASFLRRPSPPSLPSPQPFLCFSAQCWFPRDRSVFIQLSEARLGMLSCRCRSLALFSVVAVVIYPILRILSRVFSQTPIATPFCRCLGALCGLFVVSYMFFLDRSPSVHG